MLSSGHTSEHEHILIIAGHGGFKTVAKLGAPLADEEETETFAAEQSFGDVLISVSGEMHRFKNKK